MNNDYISIDEVMLIVKPRNTIINGESIDFFGEAGDLVQSIESSDDKKENVMCLNLSKNEIFIYNKQSLVSLITCPLARIISIAHTVQHGIYTPGMGSCNDVILYIDSDYENLDFVRGIRVNGTFTIDGVYTYCTKDMLLLDYGQRISFIETLKKFNYTPLILS